jgi:hypothetical protein
LFVANRDQRLQSGDCLLFQALDKALLGAFPGKGTRRETNFFQRYGCGKQNALFTQVIDHRPKNWRHHDPCLSLGAGC